MPHFRYRAVTHAGEIVIGEGEGPPRDEGGRRVRCLGHLATEARVVGPRVLGRGAGTGRKPHGPVASALVVLLFFLIYVVPQFAPVFKDLGGRLNAGAALVLALSAGLRGNLNLLLGLCLALVAGTWLVLGRREWRARVIAAFASIPGISGTMRDRRTARIVGTLGLLVENGVALPVALKILRDIVTDPRCVLALDRVH